MVGVLSERDSSEGGDWPNSLDAYELDLLAPPLGRGRHAVVKRGAWRGKNVALKIVLKKNLRRSEADRLQNEIVVHSQLQDAGIIDIYHAFEDQRQVVLVLEAADADLASLLVPSAGGGGGGMAGVAVVSETRLRALLTSALMALRYLHSVRFRHGAIELQNLLLVGAKVKLADFACAARFEDPRDTRCAVDGVGRQVSGTAHHWARGCARKIRVFSEFFLNTTLPHS